MTEVFQMIITAFTRTDWISRDTVFAAFADSGIM